MFYSNVVVVKKTSSTVRNNFNSDISAGKMDRFVAMTIKFDKAVGEVHEFLQMVANGEEMLENQNIILESISVPSKYAITSFLEDIISQNING